MPSFDGGDPADQRPINDAAPVNYYPAPVNPEWKRIATFEQVATWHAAARLLRTHGIESLMRGGADDAPGYDLLVLQTVADWAGFVLRQQPLQENPGALHGFPVEPLAGSMPGTQTDNAAEADLPMAAVADVPLPPSLSPQQLRRYDRALALMWLLLLTAMAILLVFSFAAWG